MSPSLEQLQILQAPSCGGNMLNSTVNLPSDLQQLDEYLPSYLISGRRRTVLIRTSTLFPGFVVVFRRGGSSRDL